MHTMTNRTTATAQNNSGLGQLRENNKTNKINDHGANGLDLALSVKVCEIFASLQGEGQRQGLPTTFIRLSGCPLRCRWCDTTYSFSGGEKMSIHDLLARCRDFPWRQVCVTGGEPLAQKNCAPLIAALCQAGFSVSLETCGALPIAALDPRVAIVMDLKAPDSGESERNLWDNLSALRADRDEIKIVIASRTDFEWACTQYRERQLQTHAPLTITAALPLSPTQLAEWLLAESLPDIRLQVQLHKILWQDARGR